MFYGASQTVSVVNDDRSVNKSIRKVCLLFGEEKPQAGIAPTLPDYTSGAHLTELLGHYLGI